MDNSDNIRAVIEALLFVSDKPLTLEKIKIVLGGVDTSQIRELLQKMSEELQNTNRGLRIVEIAGGFRFMTAPDLAPFLKKFYKDKRVERLSKPALETLAIIAYKQPLTRLEIESLRNVNIDGVMRSLAEKDLIRIVGRKKAPGRPFVYGTTRQFLEYFGLKSLEELPKMEDFSKMATGPEVKAQAVTESTVAITEERNESGGVAQENRQFGHQDNQVA